MRILIRERLKGQSKSRRYKGQSWSDAKKGPKTKKYNAFSLSKLTRKGNKFSLKPFRKNAAVPTI